MAYTRLNPKFQTATVSGTTSNGNISSNISAMNYTVVAAWLVSDHWGAGHPVGCAKRPHVAVPHLEQHWPCVDSRQHEREHKGRVRVTALAGVVA